MPQLAPLIPLDPSPDALPGVLARLPGLVARLVREGSIVELKQGRDAVLTLRDAARRRGLAFEAQNCAAEAKLRIDRQIGKYLPEVLGTGRPRKTIGADDRFRIRLKDIPMSADLSAHCQRVARIQEGRFERFFVYANRHGWAISDELFFYRCEADAVNEVERQRHELAERMRHRPQRRAGIIPHPNIRPSCRLIRGDCLQEMPRLPDHSVHLIATDLPRGNTYARIPWDRAIDLDALFAEYWRVLVPYGVIVLLAGQPYASELTTHQREHFKYEIIWECGNASDFVHVRHRPRIVHENIVVLSTGGIGARAKHPMPYYPDSHPEDTYPRSVVYFPAEPNKLHPMQKPLVLMRWLVELYARPGQTVLDSCMGSGTTGVAALQCGCNFIGIEQERQHYEIARRRCGKFTQT
jgi:site-specific DNA-methyltransferase (adenine-specific)